MTQAPIVMWQMPPVWGLPNASPFCMKLETWLRMAGLSYEAKAITGPPRSKSGKLPYIERPDGSVLSDSSAIIDTLTRERHVRLDDALSEDERALGVLIQRTFEEHLYFVVLHERWVEPAGWGRVSRDYFQGFPFWLRPIVPLIRRKIVAAAWGQGVSRLSAEQRLDKARRDLAAIAHVLGDKPFLFSRPSSFDAVAYAFLSNLFGAPVPSAVADAAREHPSLSTYCERMRKTYWADWSA